MAIVEGRRSWFGAVASQWTVLTFTDKATSRVKPTERTVGARRFLSKSSFFGVAVLAFGTNRRKADHLSPPVLVGLPCHAVLAGRDTRRCGAVARFASRALLAVSDGSATSRQTSVWHSSGLCVWVGSACTGRLRDAMIASAQRAARHLIELDWTAGPPRSIDGSRLDGGAHPVPVLPQGLSRLSRLSASVVCQPLRRSASGSPLLALVACYYKRKYISTHALARQNALPNWYCLLLPAACARAH